MRIRHHENIDGLLKAPTLLAGWPGMGHVGLGGIRYVRQKLGGRMFAEVDAHEYFTPEAVEVTNGLARFPDIPKNIFYYVDKPELIIFESETQLLGDGGVELMKQILDVAEQFKVSRVYTGAAYAMPISNSEPSRVLGVANRESLRDVLLGVGVELLKEGSIQGLNGLLLGFAGLRGLEAACLMATMPQYANLLPNPKASREIVRAMEGLLKVTVDPSEIDEAVTKMDQTMSEIEEKIQAVYSQGEEQVDEGLEAVDVESVPRVVMERIERMFVEVSRNRSQVRAEALKRELDRWNLYAFYEDRFLDLFRNEKGEE